VQNAPAHGTASIAAVLGRPFTRGNADDFDETLRQLAGAFVTLTRDGDLRGCIGSIRAVEPLYKAVASSAISARVPRSALSAAAAGELEQLEIEISVMGPIELVTNIEEIVVPTRRPDHQPRTRTWFCCCHRWRLEYRWDRQTFLGQTCRKAGLPSDAWRAQIAGSKSFQRRISRISSCSPNNLGRFRQDSTCQARHNLL